jgi:hypothetical protein
MFNQLSAIINLRTVRHTFLPGTVAVVLFISPLLVFGGLVLADEDPMTPMYGMARGEAQADLSATPLAGKFVRYGYHTFWEVNKDKGVQGAPAAMVHDILFYEGGECEWFSLDIYAGEHARMKCGTVEIEPGLYQVSWLEPASKQVVTQVLNLRTWTINTSFHFNSGKGLALWAGKIYAFGDQPRPPITVPETYCTLNDCESVVDD